MAPAPDRERAGRQQKYNEIGNEGRITGVRPPTNAPRDSAGNEHPSAYFDNSDDEQRGQGARGNVARSNAPKSAAKRKPNGAVNSSHASSQGARRERPDQYADWGERGRKTGVRVALTQRDDDDFEAVDNFFHTSPSAHPSSPGNRSARKSTAKKSAPRKSKYDLPELNDPNDDGFEWPEGGGYDESDMQLDDGTSMTPSAYQRIHGKSNSAVRRFPTVAEEQDDLGRPGSAESEESDDEEIARQILPGRKGPPGRRSSVSPARSRGRRERDSDEENQAPDYYGQEEYDDQAVEEQWPKGNNAGSRPNGRTARLSDGSDTGRSTRRSSVGAPLMRLGKDGKATVIASKRKSSPRGKQRAATPTSDEDEHPRQDQSFDFDVDNGFQDVSMQLNDIPEEGESDNEGDGALPTPQKGRGRAEAAPTKRAQNKSKRPPQAGVRPVVTNYSRKRQAEDHEDGVRRSARQRLEPLEYWRNERVVYKRRQSGIAIEQVVRIPKGHSNLPHRKRTGAAGRRGGSARVKSEAPEEEGVDDATDPDGIVWNWETDEETSRRIAFTAKMIDPKPTHNNRFAFQKIFTELDYLAGGILVIPAGAEKPTKPAKDNSYVFYCIEGSVSVVIHRTRFAIGPGGTFFIPRGNNYSITATSNRDVKLFFTQGRRVIEEPDGTARPDTHEESRRISMSQQTVAEEDEEEEEEEEEE